MILHEFDEAAYSWTKQNFNRIAWDDFAKARRVFQWSSIPNPLEYGSDDYWEWKKLFDNYFGKRCNFNFMIRLINSFLITSAKPLISNMK
ncbi:MAG: hypothetical protein RR515_02315 [Clostridium sp.]